MQGEWESVDHLFLHCCSWFSVGYLLKKANLAGPLPYRCRSFYAEIDGIWGKEKGEILGEVASLAIVWVILGRKNKKILVIRIIKRGMCATFGFIICMTQKRNVLMFLSLLFDS